MIILSIFLIISYYIIIVSKCRTAYITIAISNAFVVCSNAKKIQYITIKYIIIISIPLIIIFAYYLYTIKPMSVHGRMLMNKISFEMIMENPFIGIGYCQFSKQYNIFLLEYMQDKRVSCVDRMCASPCKNAMSYFVEIGVELGLVGALIYLLFTILVLKEIIKVFLTKKTHSKKHSFNKQYVNCENMIIGISAVIISYMIMSLTHHPNKILSIYFINIYCVSLLVTWNSRCCKDFLSIQKNYINVKKMT